MDVWFTEHQTPAVTIGLRVNAVLWREKTPYQELTVLDTEAYGRMLVLDGAIQTTSADEFVYHEMIAHVPLASHPHPKRVAVIGGGDGGVIREILKHPTVEEAHLVEIDERVVEIARRFFPEISSGLQDERAHIHFVDGIEWIRQEKGLDVVIVDSTDPVGPATGLFTPEFYATVAEALGPDGILVAQSESPFLEPDIVRRAFGGVRSAFPVAALYLAAVPTYPSGLWSFAFGAKSGLPGILADPGRVISARYWTPEVHRAAFQLPKFVQDLLEDA